MFFFSRGFDNGRLPRYGTPKLPPVMKKYSPLVDDLSHHVEVYYHPIEISVRGQVSKNNKACIILSIIT